jgi:hypothetical protein
MKDFLDPGYLSVSVLSKQMLPLFLFAQIYSA